MLNSPTASTVCRQPGCPNLTPCSAHPEGRSGAPRGSTRAWRAQRERVLRRDGHVCQLQLVCDGARATHVDHRVPVASGGGDEITNLRAACARCNAARGGGG